MASMAKAESTAKQGMSISFTVFGHPGVGHLFSMDKRREKLRFER